MNGAWKRHPLGALCEFRAGLWKGEKGPLCRVGVVRNTNFTRSGELNFSDVAYLDVEERAFLTRRLSPGDIILEKSGGGPKQAVGRVCIFNAAVGDFSFSNFTAALTIRNKETLRPRFLLWFLMWCYESGVTLGMQSHSTGIRNLDGNAYKNIGVPVPPLWEQDRIVSILDEAFEGIEASKAAVEESRAKVLALGARQLSEALQDAADEFGTVPLSAFCIFENGDRGENYPNKSARVAVGVPFINAGHLSEREIDMSSMDYISAERFALLRSGKPLEGDLLFCLRGSLGKFGVVRGLGDCAIASSLVIARPKPGVSSDYISAYFGSAMCAEMIDAHRSGTAQPNLGAKQLATFRIPNLDAARQDALVQQTIRFARECRLLEATYQAKHTAIAELKMALLARAFSGNLTQDPMAA